jgi:excinuclease ABC subunit B
MKRAILSIREELGRASRSLRSDGKLLEAQRIKMRTEYDLEMMEEMGFCSGIENYSRHIAKRRRGRGRTTVIDFFPGLICWCWMNRTSACPQIGGMFEGDRSRKRFWWITVFGCRARWTIAR